MDDMCSSGCPRPPEPSPLIQAAWLLYTMVTWPHTVRQLKGAGFRRTGWMTWESSPDDV